MRDFAGGSFDVKKVAGHSLAFAGEPIRFVSILQRGKHSRGERSGISWGDELAGNIFLNDVRETTDICGDDRNSAEKGFYN